jgi:hypothetical protein
LAGLSSITRPEECDGGVYAELEAIPSSRDIPAAFRLFVTPIVRRVSRDSLATYLHQTKVALDASMARLTQNLLFVCSSMGDLLITNQLTYSLWTPMAM